MTEPLGELLRANPLPSLDDGGKGSRDNLVIVGGAAACPGSALLAGRAALRCGSGRVQLVVHPDVAAAVGATLPEALVLAWDHTSAVPAQVVERLAMAGAVIVGPGLGEGAPASAVAISHHVGDATLVVDALAIPAIVSDDLDRSGPRLAAPNASEAARLLDGDDGDDDDEPDVAALAGRLAARLSGAAAVRGALTVVDDGAGGQWAERSSVPALGTPGSGDVLMGALGACLVRGAPPPAALGWAVALHACAGARLAADHPVGFLASEVADALPAALVELAAT